jgi:hypothetical protein
MAPDAERNSYGQYLPKVAPQLLHMITRVSKQHHACPQLRAGASCGEKFFNKSFPPQVAPHGRSRGEWRALRCCRRLRCHRRQRSLSASPRQPSRPKAPSPQVECAMKLSTTARKCSPRRAVDGRRAPQLKKDRELPDAARVLLNEAAQQQAVAPVIENVEIRISHEPTRTMVVPRP